MTTKELQLIWAKIKSKFAAINGSTSLDFNANVAHAYEYLASLRSGSIQTLYDTQGISITDPLSYSSVNLYYPALENGLSKSGTIALTSDIPSVSGFAASADLADTSAATKGAGMVGYDKTLNYGNGTLGDAVKDLETTVAGIVSTGGEANIIEEVQLNGTPLTVTNKAVNVTAATGYTLAGSLVAIPAVDGVLNIPAVSASSQGVSGKDGVLTSAQYEALLDDLDGVVYEDDIITGGKINSSLLPSYVDDVLEYNSLSAFPATGESGKIYVATDTNKVYRWSGSTYVEIASSPDLTSYSTKAETVSSVNNATQSSSELISVNKDPNTARTGNYTLANGNSGTYTYYETTYGNATADVINGQAITPGLNGLMSHSDKTKLDNINTSTLLNIVHAGMSNGSMRTISSYSVSGDTITATYSSTTVVPDANTLYVDLATGSTRVYKASTGYVEIVHELTSSEVNTICV